LKKPGFARARQRGSHVVLTRMGADGRRRIRVVPLHEEVAVGTLRGILRQADMSAEQLPSALWQPLRR
jgi:predicted RNA binding protein YcfA (HicA-like mRNA interferase family)